jgi:hypothetical protein
MADTSSLLLDQACAQISGVPTGRGSFFDKTGNELPAYNRKSLRDKDI